MTEPRRATPAMGPNRSSGDTMILEKNRRLLIGKLLAQYGVLKDYAEKQVDSWMAKAPSNNETGKSTAEDKKADRST
jgi:hypothetical protein